MGKLGNEVIMRNLAVLVSAVSAFLQSISLPNVFPPFLSDDFAPYLIAQPMSPGSLQFTVTTSSSYLITVNTTYVGSFTGNKTVTLASLGVGTHQLGISNGGQSYTFTVLVGGAQNFTHSVSVDATACTPDCGSFPGSSVFALTAASPVQAMIFNYIARVGVWVTVQSSQTFTPVALDNYLVVMEGVGFQVHKGFRAAKSTQPASIAWKSTLGFSEFAIYPRYHPQRTLYTLAPMLESSVGFSLSLKTTCYGACSVTIDSSSADFASVAVAQGTWSQAVQIMQNDTVIISFSDPDGILSTDYYAITVAVKSRDKYLKSLSLVAGAAKDSYAAYTSPASLAAAVKGPQIQFVEAFNTVRLAYTLPDLDFNSTLALVLITEAQSSLSAIAAQSNTTALSPYWPSNKTYVPMVGTNVITVKVTAQDAGYSSLTIITFKMLSNNADLQSISILGGIWEQDFSPNITEFTVGIPADWVSFPLIVHTADPQSFLSMYSTFTLPFQNLSGTLNATIPLPQLAFYNQSFVLRVNAETRNIVKQTVVWLWKEDKCGNGLRYSSNEQCDDGNVRSGDGCDPLCVVEIGYGCVGGSTSQKDVCSLLIPKTNETDPETNATDPHTNTTEPVCGNRLVEGTEECDDGNRLDGDGCSANCTLQAVCGNGLKESSEQCDDGNLASGDGCSANCTHEIVCGNGVKEGDEQCDDGNRLDGDGCSANCTTEAVCGNGVRESGEECDDGNLLGGDGCSGNCTAEATCGNGVRESYEQCDDRNTVSEDGCSQNCTLESGWECASSPLQFDICTQSNPQLRLASSPDAYFSYEYMGVSFGFPFVVLLLAIIGGAALLRLKGVQIGLWLAAGAGFLIATIQLLYILHDVGLEGDRAKIFAGFSWSHLRFDTSYPPFHSRRLASLGSSEHVRFFDYTLPFLLLVGCVVGGQGVAYMFIRPWALIDQWVPVYFVTFMVTHVPILYYTVVSLAHLPELASAYDSINAVAALVVLVLMLGVVALYAVTLRKAWRDNSFEHFESIRCILCPGIKKPIEVVKKMGRDSSSEFPSSEVPKRLNQSYDETAIRDNNGFDDVENEESTARAKIMSADTQKKKQGAIPDFSMYLSKSRVMPSIGARWSLTYLLHFSETMLCTVALSLGQTKLGRLTPALITSALTASVFLWQRPFTRLCYNLSHCCVRIAFVVLLLLLAIGAEVDDAGVIVVVFWVMGMALALEVCEVAEIVVVLLAEVKSPGKPGSDEMLQQPNVREFTLHGDDHLSLEPPESIPEERHASSFGINEENVCPEFEDEAAQD